MTTTDAERRYGIAADPKLAQGLIADLTSALNVALAYARPPDNERERLELAGCLDTLADGTRAVHGPDKDPAVHKHLAGVHGPPRAHTPGLANTGREFCTNTERFHGCTPAVGLRVAVYDPRAMLLGEGVVSLVDTFLGCAHIDVTPGSVRQVDRMPFPLPSDHAEEWPVTTWIDTPDYPYTVHLEPGSPPLPVIVQGDGGEYETTVIPAGTPFEVVFGPDTGVTFDALRGGLIVRQVEVTP